MECVNAAAESRADVPILVHFHEHNAPASSSQMPAYVQRLGHLATCVKNTCTISFTTAVLCCI
jgi:hypothetical protein